MQFTVEFSDEAKKELQKLDKQTALVIRLWVRRHLEGTDDPRRFGKPLKGNLSKFWSYRMGTYRAIADIQDNKINIFIFEVAHRKEVYELVEHLLKGRKK